jgi:hypothetical protein
MSGNVAPTVEIIADTSSLDRSTMGSITGQLFLRAPTGDFPETQWSDFPVVVLAWWVAGLTELVAGHQRSFQGLFMDGPFAFIVERGSSGSGRIALGKRGHEVPVGIVDIAALLQSAVVAGAHVANACRARNWSSSDLDELERVVGRGQ